MGMGDRLDRQASPEARPWRIRVASRGLHHCEWTATSDRRSERLVGPFDIFYVTRQTNHKAHSTQ